MGPTWRHFRTLKPSRIASKFDTDVDTLSEPSWHRFLDDFGVQNGWFWDANRVEFQEDVQHVESV